MSEKIHQDKFKKLFKRQNGRCFYCLKKFADKRTSVNSLKKATTDHIIPQCEMKGMSYKEKSTMNTVLACKECNCRKANISAELFLEGYEALNISPWNEQSFYIAVKTRSKRRFYHKFFNW